MKRIGDLYGKIISFQNLYDSAHLAAKGKKKRADVQSFLYNLENELVILQGELAERIYSPRPYTIFTIADPKERTIAAAKFRDRVVHHAVCRVIEPWLERSFIYDTYACRKGKGTHKALLRSQHFLRQYPYYLKCDIQKFFESIPHSSLQECLLRKFKDKELLWLLDVIIQTAPGSIPSQGIPIGNLTSQYFANLFLDGLDHLVKDRLGILGYLRYMDDFVLFAKTKEELYNARFEMEDFLAQKGLVLKEKQTYLNASYQGLPFLGFRVFPGSFRIKRESWKRFKKKFKAKEKAFAKNQISYTSFTNSIASLIGHLSHGNTKNLRNQFIEKYSMDF
ncbi:MAG: RNA-directed DNA polymerase [Candidatus Brocadiae bacterium]|nr:RNA-directed DNA polymerase [Candidatus Brocadiia bacterium]